MKEMWQLGDWPVVAKRFEAPARHLVEACRVAAGQTVFDVAAGNGNAAVWSARVGAEVVAIDLSPSLVAKGKSRTDGESLAVDWVQGDMENLPFEDGSFDSVLCAFGVTFALDPVKALSEMFRVVNPGGKVGLLNWAQDGWSADCAGIFQTHVGNSSATRVMRQWGSIQSARALLCPFAASVEFHRGGIEEEFRSPEEWWADVSGHLPPFAAAKMLLPAEAFQALGQDLVSALRKTASSTATGIKCSSEYLIAVAGKNSHHGRNTS